MEPDRLWAFLAILNHTCLAALLGSPRVDSLDMSAQVRAKRAVTLRMPSYSHTTRQILFSWEEIFASNSPIASARECDTQGELPDFRVRHF
jgi:hypothetical protein